MHARRNVVTARDVTSLQCDA